MSEVEMEATVSFEEILEKDRDWETETTEVETETST